MNKFEMYSFVKSLDVILQNPDEKLVVKQIKQIVENVLIETETKKHYGSSKKPKADTSEED